MQHSNETQLKAEWLAAEIIILGLIEHIEKVKGRDFPLFSIKMYIVIFQ